MTALGFNPRSTSPLQECRGATICVLAICRVSVSVARFPLKDPQNVAPRRVIVRIRTLGWKPKAIEESASSTSLSANAVNGQETSNHREHRGTQRNLIIYFVIFAVPKSQLRSRKFLGVPRIIKSSRILVGLVTPKSLPCKTTAAILHRLVAVTTKLIHWLVSC